MRKRSLILEEEREREGIHFAYSIRKGEGGLAGLDGFPE
jgi:hypothetical protein